MTAPLDFPVEEIPDALDVRAVLSRVASHQPRGGARGISSGMQRPALHLSIWICSAFGDFRVLLARSSTIISGISSPRRVWLLQRYKVEIEVFAEYRAIQLLPELRAQKQSDKIRRFAAYLSNYAIKRPEFIGLAAAVRYERACWELRELKAALHAPPPLTAAVAGAATWADFLRLVPTPIGPLRIESFDCDPARLVASILDETFVGYPTGNRPAILSSSSIHRICCCGYPKLKNCPRCFCR